MSTPSSFDARIEALVGRMKPITLEEMSSIRLMNRTDTKFVADKAALVRLLERAQGQYYAQQNAGSRIGDYMTTYWDTAAHFFYLEHHNGRAPRQKVRVRTYMDSLATFLEVKTKNNHGRTKKKRIAVADAGRLREADGDAFLQRLTGRTLDDLRPTVRNRFHRITLVNFGMTERLTIDFDIAFLNHETGRRATTGNLVVIELKRDGNVPSPVTEILRDLRVKPSGFSKYCIGTVLTNPRLKHNLFKERLVGFRKLMS